MPWTREEKLPSWGNRIEEEAVDAVADTRAVVVRLHMDIRGAVEGGAAEDVVDHAHHGRIVGLALELADVDGALRLRRGGAHGQPEVHLERVVEPFARGRSRGRPAVGLLDGVLDGARGADAEVDVEPGGPSQIVHGHDVQRVGGGHDQPSSRSQRRDDAVLAGDLLRHELDHVGVEGVEILSGDRFLAELRAEVFEEYVLVDELHVDEDLPEALAGLALAVEGLVELVGGQHLFIDEHLAQGQPRPAVLRYAHSATHPAPISSSRATIDARSGLSPALLSRNAR